MSTETDTTDTTDTAEAPATDAGTEVDTGDEVLLPVLSITADALARVIEIRDAEDDPGSLCLRVGITGTNGAEYSYDLAFEEIAGVDEADDVSVQKGLTVVVAADSVERMRGATLDVPSRDGQGGLVIRNPNRPNPLSGRDIELTGDNADLVGVEDTTVFLSMGGGCQGCAMSAATLREGIQVAIKEAIPEVTDIVDVTDHDAGASPFYS
jgi:Fe/S biogenesis protein NfuA